MRPVERDIIRCSCGRWAKSSPCYWCRIEASAEASAKPVEEMRLHRWRARLRETPNAGRAVLKRAGIA